MSRKGVYMEVRELKLIKNKDGHGTINYKVCLPTKWIKYLELEKEEKIIVYINDNIIIIKSKGEFKMEQILEKLNEELLNKEMTLLEMDNLAEEITESTSSLFDAEEDCIEQQSCAYYIKEDKNIIIEFEILNKCEDNKETFVKITNIWED